MSEYWRGLVYAGKDYSMWMQVSNLGRFRNPQTGTIRKMKVSNRGYYVLLFTMGSRKHRKNIFCHKAVAETWIPNPENKPFVNHNAVKLGLLDNTELIERQRTKHSRKLKATNLATDDVLFFSSQDEASQYLHEKS